MRGRTIRPRAVWRNSGECFHPKGMRDIQKILSSPPHRKRKQKALACRRGNAKLQRVFFKPTCVQNNGLSVGHSASLREICSHPSKENDAGPCKPSFKYTELKISDTFSVVLGVMKGQHVALRGQPLSIMLTTPAFRSQRPWVKPCLRESGSTHREARKTPQQRPQNPQGLAHATTHQISHNYLRYPTLAQPTKDPPYPIDVDRCNSASQESEVKSFRTSKMIPGANVSRKSSQVTNIRRTSRCRCRISNNTLQDNAP